MENKETLNSDTTEKSSEEEVSLIPEEGVVVEDETFLEEDDSMFDPEEEDEFFEGDFFWVFQKFMWGLLQILVVGFMIFVLIWWLGGKFWGGEEEEDPTETKQEVVVEQKEEDEGGFWAWLTKNNEDPVKEATTENSEEGNVEVVPESSTVEVGVAPFAKEDLLNQSLKWLNATSVLGGTVIDNVNSTPNNQERIKKIEYLLNDSEKILVEAQRLKGIWGQLFDTQKQTEEKLEEQIKFIDTQMKKNFSQFDQAMNTNIEQLKVYKKAYVQVSQDREVSEMMLKNITNFEGSFRKKMLPLIPNPSRIEAAR